MTRYSNGVCAAVVGLSLLSFGLYPVQAQQLPPQSPPLGTQQLYEGSPSEAAPSLDSPMACLIEPYVVSEIGSPIAGIIKTVMVMRGDTVKKGDVLAQLSKTVDEATLDLRKSEAAYLGRASRRNADLYKRKLMPASDYDEVVSRARQAQLQVELQQAILEERTIRSPFDGVVAERYAGPGDRVNDNKILKVAQIDPLLVKVVVPAGLYGQIKLDTQASVAVDQAIDTQALQATVWRIDKVMDAASGTFTVLLKLDNPDNGIPAGIRCSIQF